MNDVEPAIKLTGGDNFFEPEKDKKIQAAVDRIESQK